MTAAVDSPVVEERRSPPGRRPRAWRMPLVVYVEAQIVLLLWWAGQRPGLLSPDSVRYVIHVTTGPWTADHSVLYDAAVLLSLKVAHSVQLVTLAQTTLYAALLAYFAASVRAMGVPGRWAALPALVLPFLPTFGAFVATLWKDVPFAAAELFLVATILRLLVRRRRPDGGPTWPLLASLFVGLLGVVLFRNNGFLMVPIITAIVAVALPGLRLKVLSIGLAAVAAFYLASRIVYPAAHIVPANSSLSYGVFYGDIAYAYRVAPASFTAADTALMAKEASLAQWRAGGRTCYTSDPLFTKRFDLATADANRAALAKLWLRVAQRTPGVLASSRLCRADIAWNVRPPTGAEVMHGLALAVPKTLYHPQDSLVLPEVARNLQPHPVPVGLGDLAARLRTDVEARPWQWLIYRGGTWCYAAYLGLLVAAYRLGRRDVLAAGAVSLANQLVVLMANPAQLYRYMVGPIFIGMLLLPLVGVRRRPGDLSGPGDLSRRTAS